MALNPTGYVSPYDGGNPRIVSATAIAATSGGQFAFASGAADAVSSGLNSFVTGDMLAAVSASGAKFNGVILTNAASGGEVGIVTRGLVIVRATGTIVNGEPVQSEGADGVAPLAAVSGADIPAQITQAIKIKMGRAWANATSGNFALVELTP